MVELLIAGLLVVWLAPAFVRAEPGPGPVRLVAAIGRRILVSIDRIEAATQRRQSLYDSWSRHADPRPTESDRPR